MQICRMIGLLLAVGWAAQAASDAPAGTRVWLRHVIPLPKEIRFQGFVKRRPAEIVVSTRAGAADVEQRAADVLTQTLGSVPPAAEPGFRILLGVCDRSGKLGQETIPGAEKLAGLRNSDQAYVITPMPGNRLVCTGLTERGVYYAALTLAQLLRTDQTPDATTVPLVQVLDWPDLSERGEWGGNASSDIEWMSALKLNLVEAHARLSVSPEGVAHATFSQDLIENGRLHALKMVPIIMHLDQIFRTGILEAFPDLKGIGKKARPGDTLQALCFSKPQAVKVLGEWMTDLAQQPQVTDLCVWLSEDPVQCECEQCAGTPQHVLEARACVTAWRQACKVSPALKLRLLLTQGTYKTNDQVLAAAPADVYVSYYDGGRTYDSSRDPMIYALLTDYASSGRWLGVYPQLTASWRIVCPWSGPQFIKFRMTEFVDKQLSNLCGYATPSNRLYDFNVTAAAEWSWNAHGRDEREFACAWATRRGIGDPERAAEWAMTLGNVGWDIYGSRVPYTAFFGEAGRMIRGRAKPSLGKGMYRYFYSEAKLQEDLQACRQATELAAALQFPEITYETQVVSGYMTMLDELYHMADLISRSTPPTDAERLGLQRRLASFAEAGMQVSGGLRAWADACLSGGAGGGRLGDTIRVTEETVADVCKALAPFGVRSALTPYLVKGIGAWQDSDFEETQGIVKTFDVTESISGPGVYHVRPVYTKGWNGLNTARVALATAPRDQPDKLTVVAEDKHPAFSGAQPKDDLYSCPCAGFPG